MSAYIVENVTISKILYFLASPARHQLCGIPSEFSLKDLETKEGIRTLGQRMLDLNVRSVSERYATTESADPFAYVGPKGAHDPVVVLKALRCFLYQSCEGTCNKDPLFLSLSEFSDELAHAIVSRLPAYVNADWG